MTETLGPWKRPTTLGLAMAYSGSVAVFHGFVTILSAVDVLRQNRGSIALLWAVVCAATLVAWLPWPPAVNRRMEPLAAAVVGLAMLAPMPVLGSPVMAFVVIFVAGLVALGRKKDQAAGSPGVPTAGRALPEAVPGAPDVAWALRPLRVGVLLAVLGLILAITFFLPYLATRSVGTGFGFLLAAFFFFLPLLWVALAFLIAGHVRVGQVRHAPGLRVLAWTYGSAAVVAGSILGFIAADADGNGFWPILVMLVGPWAALCATALFQLGRVRRASAAA